ncbi:Aste57867_9643 [Aphanomyces stellatus]|uniref:Aste57867_9643 protein n=1 Tax=Aphanomyces stellatus TaxID=120398 RepID=A0A485KNE2_9STRA|nr:hypothetical protein As57867_009605 [Aphanomyces stellatus]VFT86522.1 Aste57867_9643 [Aphanomyces stellatus]
MSSSTAAAATPSLTCKYIYKSCDSLRSTKKNGKLHSLCEYHRQKANMVQKAYARKKRNLSSEAPVYSPTMSSPVTVSEPLTKTQWLLEPTLDAFCLVSDGLGMPECPQNTFQGLLDPSQVLWWQPVDSATLTWEDYSILHDILL